MAERASMRGSEMRTFLDGTDCLSKTKTRQVPNCMKSAKPFLITALILLTALACSLTSLRAAVPIGTVQTFDALPAVADWSTLSIGTAGYNFNDFTTLDAAVQTNSASMINGVLGSSATVPPSANAIARWNSAQHYLQTRPTGNGAALLLATLKNNGATALNSLDIGYDLNTFNPANEGSLIGHEVYYSMTGAEQTWVHISGISENAT